MQIGRIARALAIIVAAAMVGACGAGDGAAGGGEGGGPIRIGFIGSLSGDGAFFGQNAQKGAQAAIEVINGDGGIDGRQLELVSRDSQGDPTEALGAAREFAADESVYAVIGPDVSATVEAALPVLEQAHLSHYSISSAVTPEPRSYHFAAYTDAEDSIRKALENVRDTQGVTRIGMLASNDETGQVNVELLERLVPELGMEVAIERFDLTASDVSPQIRRLQSRDVDGYLVAVSGAAFGVVMRDLASAGQLELPVIGYSSNTIGDVLTDLLQGLDPEYLIFQTWKPTVWDQLPEDDPQRQVAETMSQHTEVNMLTAGGWDGVQLWAEAMRAALETGDGITRESIKEQAEQLTLVGALATAEMSPEDHRGTEAEDSPVVRWVDNRLELVEGNAAQE